MPTFATLALRQLNRAILAHQFLLDRGKEQRHRAVCATGTEPQPLYFGPWIRLSRFSPADISALRDRKAADHTVMLRSTLHWVSREDFHRMRSTIQPALERAWQGPFGKRKEGIVVGPMPEGAREILSAGPVSLTALSTQLFAKFPQTLYDLADQALPQEGGPAMVRLVPELDNLVFGNADRTRILPAAFRNRFLLTTGRLLSIILVDGFVSVLWKWRRNR